MSTQTQFGSAVAQRFDELLVGPFPCRMLVLIEADHFLDGLELYLSAGLLDAHTKYG
jgi:hypothetical protein